MIIFFYFPAVTDRSPLSVGMPSSLASPEEFLHNNNNNNTNDLLSSTLNFALDPTTASGLTNDSSIGGLGYDYPGSGGDDYPLGDYDAAGGGVGPHPNVTVIDNTTYCWDQNLQSYTWCQNEYQLYSVPLSK